MTATTQPNRAGAQSATLTEVKRRLQNFTAPSFDRFTVEALVSELEAALSHADQADAARAVWRVKELEWRSPSVERDTLIRAETVFGVYRAYTHHEANGRWFWSLSGYEEASGETTSREAAKAAAQADYERRVLSAIVTRPSPAQADERVVEAIAAQIDREWRAKNGLNCTEVCAIVKGYSYRRVGAFYTYPPVQAVTEVMVRAAESAFYGSIHPDMRAAISAALAARQ